MTASQVVYRTAKSSSASKGRWYWPSGDGWSACGRIRLAASGESARLVPVDERCGAVGCAYLWASV